MFSFNPNLALKAAVLTFFQIQASNLGIQEFLQAVKAMIMITSWAETTSDKYFHLFFSDLVLLFDCCWEK